MRFSPSDAASLACVSLTFFAGCDAFLVPLGLRPASSLERGRGTPFKRCSTCAVTTRMSAGDSPLRGAKRSFIRRAASDLFERRRHCHGKEPAGNTAFRTSKKSVERAATGASRSAGVRALVRKVVAGAAAALVLRTSLHATSATAIMAKPRPRAPQQQLLDDEKSDAKAVAAAEREIAALEARLGMSESEDGGDALERKVLAAERASEAMKAQKGRKLTRREKTELLRELIKDPNFKPQTISTSADEGFDTMQVLMTTALLGLMFGKAIRGSADVMNKQRKRVRVETAKFNQQKEEFMNVQGEAEIDTDIMKELRDLKENMAGPRDKYAKETRQFNPKYADEHPEEDYDKKIKEALHRGKGKPTDKNTGTGKQPSAKTTSKAGAEDDDLLGMEEREAEEARGKEDRLAADKAKKDADVERLKKLFNSSPNDEGDNLDDADKRELLP